MPGPPGDSDERPAVPRLPFEASVIRILRLRLGVRLQTDEVWDHEEMTDFVAETDGERPMPFRTEVQLTKQGGNLHKLEQFIRISEKRPDVLRVYIMPVSWLRATDAARAVRDILRYLRRVKQPGIRCFFIEDGPVWKQTNARQRLEFLRRRCSPTNRRRRSGVIASVDLARQRLVIRDGDGRERLALMGDAEGPLAAALKRRANRPEKRWSSPVGWHVTFIPHVEERGPHAGNLRALSVIFPPRP